MPVQVAEVHCKPHELWREEEHLLVLHFLHG